MAKTHEPATAQQVAKGSRVRLDPVAHEALLAVLEAGEEARESLTELLRGMPIRKAFSHRLHETALRTAITTARKVLEGEA